MKYFITTVGAAMMALLAATAMTISLSSCITDEPNLVDDPIPVDTTLMPLKAEYATVPVYNNWVFENVQPSLKMTFKNPEDTVRQAVVQWIVTTDKKAAVLTKDTTLNVPAGTSELVMPLAINNPGIYKVSASMNGKFMRAFNIAVDPTEIVSPVDKQADFDQFWADTRAELALIEPQYTLTEIPEKSSSARKVYLLEFRSLKDMGDTAAIARAYWCEPTDGKAHRVTIHYQGYDSGGYKPWIPNGNDNPNECDLFLSTRGQLINNRAPYTNKYGDWFAYGFTSKETWYYRGAFCDAIRALDFVHTRSAADKLNVFAEGSSQGGALAYAAAALGNHKFNAIAPCVPFLGDYPDYFEIVSWPGNTAKTAKKANGWTDEQLYEMLSYFDTKNLATLVTCPVIETIGLQDGTCPPHTNLAPYNNLPAGVDKEISYHAEMQHAIPSNWSNTYRTFFKKYVVE